MTTTKDNRAEHKEESDLDRMINDEQKEEKVEIEKDVNEVSPACKNMRYFINVKKACHQASYWHDRFCLCVGPHL